MVLTTKKNIFGHHLKALFMPITIARVPDSYFIHIPRYDVSIVWHWIHGVCKCLSYVLFYSVGSLGKGWGMDLGFAPLWSTWMEHSNDFHFAVGWILTQNHGLARFLAKIWPTLKSTSKTSFERAFHADHNGTIPSFITHFHTKLQCDFPWIMNTWSRN